MRRGGAGAHQIGELVEFVAVVGRAVVPIGRGRVIGDDPGAAGVDALRHHAHARDQLVALQLHVADDLLDLAAQPAHVELGLQDRDGCTFAHEGERRELGIDLAHLRGAIAERERAGDDRAGRRAADKLEMVAQSDRPAVMLREQRLDALEKRDRDRPTHAAAVERQHALGPRPEQLIVARAGVAVRGLGARGRLGCWPFLQHGAASNGRCPVSPISGPRRPSVWRVRWPENSLRASPAADSRRGYCLHRT